MFQGEFAMNTKRIASFLLFIFSLFAISSAAGQVLDNPGFEPGRNNSNSMGWQTHTWTGKADFLTENAGHKDSSSVMISSQDGADAAWTQAVSLSPFGKYKLSGWIKTENVTATTGKGALLNISDLIKTKALTGTNDWTYLEYEFEANGLDSGQVNCLFGGWGQTAGKAWYDDVQLELISEKKPESKIISTSIQIDAAKTGEPISKYIYGQFIEHLGQCIYGGIWAEMLEDCKFYFPVPAQGEPWRTTDEQARVLRASPWKVFGSADAVSMTTQNPLSGKHSPQLALSGDPAGIYQDELALVKGRDYSGRIILYGDSSVSPIQVSLVWGEGDNDRRTVIIKKPSNKYKTYTFKFTSGADTDNARLEIIGEGKGSLVIGAVSLMPADNVEGFRKDTLELLKELNAPVYRWPGGNFVSGYDWRDGLGDRDRRPTRANPAWTGIETNDMGMHEFIALCKLINTEPMIAVNTGFGDAYSAAAEVEYANGATDTPMGKWRAQNGAKKPFAVKWWCVGNEMFGNWQIGYMRLEHYVLKHNWVEEKMRQVDPTIKTVASGEAGPWSEGMLKNCADHMDLISEHFYCQARPGLTAHVRQIPDAIKGKCDAHRRYRDTIEGLKDKDIRIAMDEWNYWYGPNLYGEIGTRYYMKDALGIAAGLHEYFRNSDICFMANYAQTVNVIGCIKTTKTAAAFDTTGYPLVLYRKEFGTIPLTVSGWNEKLDVSAALTEDKKYLTIGIVNATYDRYEIALDISNMKPSGKAAGWVIANDNPRAYNEPGKDLVVKIEDLPATDLSGKVSIKPVSITLFKVPVK
jgi:alpha-N-arabinofuranosidase